MSKKSPQLRFEGFTDDWEERKFKDILKTHSFRSYLADISENGEYEVIQQGDKPIVGYSDGKPFTNYKDITLFGDHTVSLYKPKRPFFVATDGVKILSADNFEGDYLYTTLERYKPEPQGYKRHFTILKNQDVWFTGNMEEQQKIGSFFKQLDITIALHQRKLDLLKEQKKGYLQKMFPKNGAKVPELRFAGFADDWEQRKLGEMLEDKTILEQSDGNHGELYPKSSEFAKEGIPYLAASNIIDNNIDYQNVKYLPLLRAEQFKKGVARDGDILLAHNATVGPSALLKINLPFVILSTTLTLYRINKDKMDNLFFLSIIRSNKVQNQLKKMMKQTTRNQVPILAQRTIDIFYPKNLKEQAKVGEFFKQLDDTIALHQRKLDLLKEQKKGFLQKMFV